MIIEYLELIFMIVVFDCVVNCDYRLLFTNSGLIIRYGVKYGGVGSGVQLLGVGVVELD